ncbi:glycosyltransferase [Hyphomicrobium sp. 99]|uniref:glycosyltransferase n=1 Tax=Hyphomicrobium sp. 99 TaxID=1163419 RepID=UPI0012E014EB|nr:glycosyltransferase [Hyphomicrobium sp. 99]
MSPEVPSFGETAGIATYLSEATSALHNAGHECHVLTWRDSGKRFRTSTQFKHFLHVVPIKFDDYKMVDRNLFISATVADAVLALHREHGFDVIEGTDWCAPLYCLLQRRNVEPSLRNCLITVFNHGTTYNIARHQKAFIPRSTFQSVNLEYQCFRLADKVICPSEAAAKSLTIAQDIAADRMEVIPEPLDLVSKQVSSTWNPSKILWYGTVIVSKGLTQFTDLAKRFLYYHPQFNVEFVGPVRPMDVPMEEFKQKILREFYPFSDRVSFVPGKPREVSLERVGEADVLINMSPRETFCYAAAETILCGVAPVMLAGSAQSEFIPPALRQRYCVDAGSRDISAYPIDQFFRHMEDDRPEIIHHVAERTAPARYVEAYEQLVPKTASTYIAPARIESDWAVSVLIPACNPDGFLLDTIESALRQSEMPAKVIVGNDGSSKPESLEILKKAATYKNVEVINFNWRGLAETRNRLLDSCDTPLFVFVDADDLLLPDFVAVSRKYIQSNFSENVRSVQGWYEMFGSETGVRAPTVFQHFSHFVWNDLKNNHMGHTQSFQELRYNSGLTRGEAEDWEFWLRYFKAGYETRVIPQVLWRYRRHPAAMSVKWSQEMSVGTARANVKILSDYLATATRSTEHIWEFIGDYLYLGEVFFRDLPSGGAYTGNSSRRVAKIQRSLSEFQRSGRALNMKQRLALSLMRSLAHTFKT